MNAFVRKDLISALDTLPDEEKSIFMTKVKELRKTVKNDIADSKEVVILEKNSEFPLYAYHIEKSFYILFTFKDKQSILILDRIELLGNNELESLVYSNDNADDSKEDSSNNT